MENIIVEIVKKLPSWSFHVIAFLIIIAFIIYLVKVFRRDTKLDQILENTLKSSSKIENYVVQNETLKNHVRNIENMNSQLISCMYSIKSLSNLLIQIEQLDEMIDVIHETQALFQRTIENLAYDIKALSGDKHRCGIWINQNGHLILIFASSGFPKDYPGQRTLELDRSIAGRCFRKKEIINCPDITKDDDWAMNPQSNSQYKSLICIPLGTWGVLTIDSHRPLDQTYVLIGELYASIIEGTMLKLVKTLVRTAFTSPDGNPEEQEDAS